MFRKPAYSILSLLLAASAAKAGTLQKEKLKIGFFAPHSKNNTYWPQVYAVIEEVARDLNFEFVHYDFGSEDRYAVVDAMEKVVNSKDRPDAILVTVSVGNAKHVLEMSEKYKIPTYLNGPLFPQEFATLGLRPRDKYKYWVGYWLQDEMEKSYQMAKRLLKRAEEVKAFNRSGQIEVIGISGNRSWYGSMQREAGLQKAMAEHPKAVLRQVINTNWLPEQGKIAVKKMLKRFPEATVVWAASDQLAIAASEALQEAGKSPGKNAFTGGLDLSDNGLQRVMEGKIEGTIASPMLAYAEIVTTLYDYLQGIDFSPELGTELKTELNLADRDTAAKYLTLSEDMKRIDFRRFSKSHNKDLKTYDFRLETMLQDVVPARNPK